MRPNRLRLAFALALLSLSSTVVAQEKTTRSILSIEEPEATLPAAPSSTKPVSAEEQPARRPVVSLTSSASRAKGITSQGNSEVIRDRYPSGKLRVERSVTLDAEGNYINHGDYREFTEKGDLIASGQYNMGQRQGSWVRVLQTSDSKLLASYPFNKFRAPFTSTVDFDRDQLSGVWVIADRDKRVACQVQLSSGSRNGSTVLFHPNGQIFQHSEFKEGVLDGSSLEKSAEGKVVREDVYTAGQKLIVETDHFANKNTKSVMRYLSGITKVTTPDNWAATTLATYASTSGKQLHGDFITYHENGQPATKGSYVHGKLEGAYESWYRTGEVSASGTYSQGQQVGPWVWRHPNGMKRASATYKDGQVEGTTLLWDENGKAISK